MAWTVSKYSKTKVDSAGAFLIAPEQAVEELFRSVQQYEEAFSVVNNWRSAHSFPLNIMQDQLRKRARSIDPECIVAQRLKRLSSIRRKLSQTSTRLSQMQDLGGCRAVVASLQHVDQLRAMYERSRMKHELIHIDDYIVTPRHTGYRGIHLIYKYRSTGRGKPYDGMRIEIQIRTRLQHAWATTVEIVDAFQEAFHELPNQLKSGMGNEKWLRFFVLMGSLMANREGCPTVPGTPSEIAAIQRETKEIASELDVERTLHSYRYGVVVGNLEMDGWNPAYFLLKLDKQKKINKLKGYKIHELQKAQAEYLAEERSLDSGWNILLASAESVVALKEAYPNYWMDSDAFLETMNDLLKE